MAKRAPLISAFLENISRRALETVRAKVTKNGKIRFQGTDYISPSAAAKACKRRNSNGWKFWRCERAPGDWVFLDTLRK